MLDMTNAEIVEILIELDEDCENDITLYQHEALKQAVEIVRRYASGEIMDRPVVGHYKYGDDPVSSYFTRCEGEATL